MFVANDLITVLVDGGLEPVVGLCRDREMQRRPAGDAENRRTSVIDSEKRDPRLPKPSVATLATKERFGGERTSGVLREAFFLVSGFPRLRE